ncbi:MAG TPA: hypothetical protein VKV74_16665 [Bryobacteraceae bacterium]|nr:hypothetical protein [Bryobacteraceae bacterium]
MNARRPAALFWICLSAAVLASRLAHLHLLWADEDYHLAAALQSLGGKLPYRDFWYDKPPLNLAFYLAFGARTGAVLRTVDALFLILCCALACEFAAKLWSRREGFLAASAMAFFLIFYLPPAVLPLEPDTLMLAPHLAAVSLAWRKKPFLAGIAAGVAFQFNVRGAFVLAFAALFYPAGIPALALGFFLPNALVFLWLAAAGALMDYTGQVWKWGWLYLRNAPSGGPLRLAGWFGFHLALLIPALALWLRERSRTLVWFALAVLFSLFGLRNAPRYLNLLLPPLVIAAAGGVKWMKPLPAAPLLAALLAIPAIRFGPRYFQLSSWRDTAMDRESRQAAALIAAAAKPGDSIFVWGYRPDIVAFARLPVAGRFLDSQPLTGVPADRHLFDSRPVAENWARANRRELARARPSFLVDGLSAYNPKLDIRGFPDLAPWLALYCPIARAGATTIYARCAPP